MNTADQILFLLKTRGAQTAQALAQELELTSMGVRKHLENWLDRGIVLAEDRSEKQGRPNRYWSLSENGHARFPDRHSELALQILKHIQHKFGDTGLQQLLQARDTDNVSTYQTQLDKLSSLTGKLKRLAQLREQEGYMCHVEPGPDGGHLLIENHCPICAAASQCQQFCQSELQLFQKVLGPRVQVERREHLMSGATRCVYWISKLS